MIIHKDNLVYDATQDIWRYWIPDIGSKNEAWIEFSAPNDVVPKTGDMIIDNRWVKGGD